MRGIQSYWNENPHFRRPFGRRIKRQKNQLQFLYKRKGQINQKTRKRKYKTRIMNSRPVRQQTSRGLSLPRRPMFVGLRANNACRMTYLTMIGMEKTFMPSRGKVQTRYRKYPNYFVTRKSTKSRMGKGKGKIMGRVLRIKKGEVVLDIKCKNIFKSTKWLHAMRLAIPTTTTLVYKNRWVRRRMALSLKNRPWIAHSRKTKRRKFWQIALDRLSALRKRKNKKKRPAYRKWPIFMKIKFRGHWFFQRWKYDNEPREKKYIAKERTTLRNYLLRRARKSARAKSLPVRKNFRGKRKLMRRLKFRMRFNYLKKVGFSGGRARHYIIRMIASRNKMERIYQQQFIPDEDGYVAPFLKMANKIIKRKMERERFSHRRHVVNPMPGYY